MLLVDLGLLAAVAAIYAHVLTFGFAKVDDLVYVTKNPHVLSGLSLENIRWAFSSFEQSNWHPLTWISLMLDAALGGGEPWAFHATNVALHAANGMLLFHLLFGGTGALGRSALVAALFAVHPAHVESVAWITERKDVLSTLFWLLAIAAHLRYARRPSPRAYALVAVFFVLGLLSKPMVVTLPLTLLLIDVWPLGRFDLRSPGTLRGWSPLTEKLPLLALSLASSLVTLAAQRSVTAPFSTLPLTARLARAVASYATYVAKTVWPSGLSIHYVFEAPLSPWRVLAGLIVVGGGTGLAVLALARRPYVATGWLWFLVTLLPVIGLVRVGEQDIADRYTYVPLIGLFVIAAWLGAELIRARTTQLGLAFVTIVALSGRAYDQTNSWRSAFDLFRHALAVNPQNSLARLGVAEELAAAGRDQEAIEQYRIALHARPWAILGHRHLAECLERTGSLEEAAAEFGKALELSADDTESALGLAVVSIEQGHADAALPVLERAAVAEPGDARIQTTLGLALTRLDRPSAAEAAFARALSLDPKSVLAHQGIAVVLANTGRTDPAIEHLRRAIELQPDSAEARANLEKLLGQKGK